MLSSRMKSRLLSRHWNDLPQDILRLILQSKRLVLSDLVRFRAVCKSWRLPKDDEIIKSLLSSSSLAYPWLFIRLRCFDSFNFNLIEPHSWKAHRISNESPLYDHPLDTTYATKHGWILNGNVQQGRVWSLFFLNPFSNHHILLPPLSFPCTVEKNVGVAATFTAIPTCLDSCEVLVLFRTMKTKTFYIGRYKYNSKDEDDKSDSWTTQLLDQEETSHVRVHYMDGKLYCFFHYLSVLKSYNLVDKTWELVSTNPMLDHIFWLWLTESNIWLTQIRSSLAMVVGSVSGRGSFEWMIFKFDWSQERWIDVGKHLGNIAFFVSQETIFSLPTQDDDDCLIFHCDSSGLFCSNKMSCYSFKQKKNIPQPQEPYPSLNTESDYCFRFVQPPFLV